MAARPITPMNEQQCRMSSHAQAKGGDPFGRRRQGVNRSGDVPAGQRKGASLVPRLAIPDRSPHPGRPCASRMIPLESPVPYVVISVMWRSCLNRLESRMAASNFTT